MLAFLLPLGLKLPASTPCSEPLDASGETAGARPGARVSRQELSSLGVDAGATAGRYESRVTAGGDWAEGMHTGARRSEELVLRSLLLRQKAHGCSKNPGCRAVPRLSTVVW